MGKKIKRYSNYTKEDQNKDEGKMVTAMKRKGFITGNTRLYVLASEFKGADDVEKTRLWLQHPEFKNFLEGKK